MYMRKWDVLIYSDKWFSTVKIMEHNKIHAMKGMYVSKKLIVYVFVYVYVYGYVFFA